MALGLTQPLTEMSTRNVSWEQMRPVHRSDNLTTFMCRLSWNLGASTCWNPRVLSRPIMRFFFFFNIYQFDVRGSVHHSTIHEERCNNVSKFYYSVFIWSSTCFGRHTAHHQEPKTALAASGFSYVEGCWTCSWWTLSGTVCLTTSTNYTSNNLPHMKNQRLPVLF